MEDFQYVYILKCADEKYYSGCTNDLEGRLARHNRVSVPATKGRRPVELITLVRFFFYKFNYYLPKILMDSLEASRFLRVY